MSDLISTYDAATLLGCSPHTVRALMRRGVLQGTPLPGGRKLWLERAQVLAAKQAMVSTIRAQRARDKTHRETLLQLWLDLT